MALVIRLAFNLLTAVSLLLLTCTATLWVRQNYPSLPPHSSSAERGASFTNRAVEAQLDRVLPAVQFDQVGLKDVIDFMQDVSGANLAVNWKAIQLQGVDKNTPLTLKLNSNIRCSVVLAKLLDSAGLAYARDGSLVCISTRADLARVGHQARTASLPEKDDPRRFSTGDWIYPYRRVSLGEAFQRYQHESGVPLDVKWESFRPLNITAETPVEMDFSGQAPDWLEALLRHASVDHDLQYKCVGGRVTIATREWFDAAERPRRRFERLILLVVSIAWLALFVRQRARRARSRFLIGSVLVLSLASGGYIWHSDSMVLRNILAGRVWKLDATAPGMLEFTIRPAVIPLYPEDVKDAGFTFANHAFGSIRILHRGPPLRETTLRAPPWSILALLAIFPSIWTALPLIELAREARRRSQGRCSACGYDLRSTPDRCPECGRPNSGT